MAKKTVSDPEVFKSTLRDIDSMSQCSCAAIDAMAEAARKMLALDPKSLMRVGVLLDEISSRAIILMDDINATAGDHGADWVGTPREQELSQKLLGEQHASRQNGEAQHG